MSTYGNKPFGLRDVKLTEFDGSPQADLPAARTLAVSERYLTNELQGDDTLVSAMSIVEAVEWELEAGGVDLDAIAIMTGRTITTSGTTPTRSSYMDVVGAACNPWFKIYGKAVSDDCTSDIHVKLRKVKVNELEYELKNGEFMITKCTGIGITDGVAIMSFIQNETAAALPGS